MIIGLIALIAHITLIWFIELIGFSFSLAQIQLLIGRFPEIDT